MVDENDPDDVATDDKDGDLDVDAPDGLDEEPADGDLETGGKDDDDDEDDVPAPKQQGSDDDDEDDDDVEADLDEILRERIAANDDDDDETPIQDARKKANVAPKRSDEWTCNQCFLIVSSSQFGTKDDPRCPSGEDPCVSLKRALG